MDPALLKELAALRNLKVADLRNTIASCSAKNRNLRIDNTYFAVSPGACRPTTKEI
jgi:hypothetical protein